MMIDELTVLDFSGSKMEENCSNLHHGQEITNMKYTFNCAFWDLISTVPQRKRNKDREADTTISRTYQLMKIVRKDVRWSSFRLPKGGFVLYCVYSMMEWKVTVYKSWIEWINQCDPFLVKVANNNALWRGSDRSFYFKDEVRVYVVEWVDWRHGWISWCAHFLNVSWAHTFTPIRDDLIFLIFSQPA